MMTNAQFNAATSIRNGLHTELEEVSQALEDRDVLAASDAVSRAATSLHLLFGICLEQLRKPGVLPAPIPPTPPPHDNGQ